MQLKVWNGRNMPYSQNSKYAFICKKKNHFKTSFVKAWNVFVLYSAIFVIEQSKYSNVTSPVPYI